MPTTHTQPLLNHEFVRVRRLELKIPAARMAARVGISPPKLALLEQGRGHGDTTLATVSRLARELNTTVEYLVSEPTKPQAAPASDDRKVEAAIHQAGRQIRLIDLCFVLDMPRRRVQAALVAVESRLEDTGAFLHRSGAAYTFGPRDGVLSADECERLGRVRRVRSELDVGEARQLRRAMLGRLDAASMQGRHLGGPARGAIGALITNGLLRQVPENGLQLTDPVAFSLGLRSRPPTRCKRRPMKGARS
jgi:transcriptional regulator with XRE-family HTH domain